MTLGLSQTRVRRESKVIRLLSIIHNGIILDLVCGFSAVVFGLSSSSFRERGARLYILCGAVRSDDPG